MKIIVSAGGRFHAFELARQLYVRGLLHRLFTAYPKQKVYEVDHAYVRTHPLLMTAYHLLNRLPIERASRILGTLPTVEYDRWVARNLDTSDLVVSLSSYAVETFRSARRMGAVTVCDRGSSHIAYQAEVLREEYRQFGIASDPMDERLMERELIEYEETDYISVPSTFVWRTFVEKGVPESKLLKIPYGVDLSVYRPMPKRDDTFRVIFAGTASIRKGIPYLLEAIAPLHLSRFEVVLVGHVQPGLEPLLRRYRGSIRRMGFVPRLRLPEVYSQGSVLVLPSIEEGLALVQAQAMACGLPVIATPNTGAEDLFTHGVEGIIVPPRSAESLRAAILQMYDNPVQRADMGRRALARVQSLGGWDTYGQLAAEQFARVLVTSRRQRVKSQVEQAPL